MEQHSREICGYSDIDYERNEASWLGTQPEQKLDPETTLRQLDQFEAEARSRGITHTTFRRLTETLDLNGKQRQDLRILGYLPIVAPRFFEFVASQGVRMAIDVPTAGQ